MLILPIQTLAVTAMLAVTAFATRILLDFDDIFVPNDNSCGTATLDFNSPYKGVFVSTANFDRVSIFNTTSTRACSSSKDESNGVSPFGRVTSSPNVAFAGMGAGMTFQLDLGALGESREINDASFDVSVVFTPEEITSNNSTVTIITETTDFGDIEDKSFTFHTAIDGFGPYHIIVPSTKPFLSLEITAMTNAADRNGLNSFLDMFIDTVSLELSA